LAADRVDVVTEDVDGDVTGLLDHCHPRPGHTDSFREFTLPPTRTSVIPTAATSARVPGYQLVAIRFGASAASGAG